VIERPATENSATVHRSIDSLQAPEGRLLHYLRLCLRLFVSLAGLGHASSSFLVCSSDPCRCEPYFFASATLFPILRCRLHRHFLNVCSDGILSLSCGNVNNELGKAGSSRKNPPSWHRRIHRLVLIRAPRTELWEVWAGSSATRTRYAHSRRLVDD